MANKMMYKVYAMDESNYDELWGMYPNLSDAQYAMCDWEQRYPEYLFTLVCEGRH